jgi:hypothetical protein
MLRALSFSCLRVILLPCETGLNPGVKNSLDKIETELAVEVFGFVLVGTREFGVFLENN